MDEQSWVSCEIVKFGSARLTYISRFPFGKNESAGIEGLIGQAGGGQPKETFGLDPQNATRGLTSPEFVKPQGGEYFFSPSISALKNTIAA